MLQTIPLFDVLMMNHQMKGQATTSQAVTMRLLVEEDVDLKLIILIIVSVIIMY